MRDNLERGIMKRVMLLAVAATVLGVAASGCKKSQGTFLTVQMKSLEDQTVTVADYRGKVVLVNFWATWCDPCRVEIPWLIEFQRKYAASGFTLLGVAMDEDGAKVVQPFVQKITFDVNGQQMLMN